uniref:Uncharacterized protein n=1 Tax=Ralstonia solanacearum TaxID=305 RepID=A0A0S4U4K3_RALSL|nr:protein of unknown function [Ralstonia solanacearum]
MIILSTFAIIEYALNHLRFFSYGTPS